MLRRSPVKPRAVHDARLAPQHRVQQLGPVVGVVLEVGVLHEHVVAGACANPVRTAAPFPRFCGCMTTRTVLSPSCFSTSRVPSVLPSSTTMISRSIPSGSSHLAHAPHDLDERVALVEDRDDDRQLADRREPVLSGPATARAPRGTTRACAQTFAQRDLRFPSEQFARPGEVGTPAGRVVDRQRLEHDLRRRTGDLEHELARVRAS